MNTVYLLLGTNLGDRNKNLEEALVCIEERIGQMVAESSVYETEPWGELQQPAFFNQALKVNSSLSPLELMEEISRIEADMGRIRTKNSRWKERLIDIDILFYNDMIMNTEKLTIPHPRLHERNFTLVPVAEISPIFIHPVFKENITDLLSRSTDKLKVVKVKGVKTT